MADTNIDPVDAELEALRAELVRRGEAAPAGPSSAAPTAQAGVPPQTDNDLQPLPADQQAGPGIIERAIGDISKGVLVEGPGAIVRGVGNAIKETGDLVGETIAGGRAAKEKLVGPSTSLIPDSAVVVEPLANGLSWIGGKIGGIYDKRETVTGNVVEGISQFVTGMISAGKVIALPSAVTKSFGGKVLQGMVRGAAVDATVFDGADGRLSNLAEEFPFAQNAVTDYLAAKPGDTQAEGRFKNALEGLVIGPVADVLLAGLRARKLFGMGDKAGGKAAADEAEALLDQLRQGPAPDQAALKSLDPENGIDAAGKPVAERVETQVVRDEGVSPGQPDLTVKPADDAAPYSTDLPMPKPGRGPIEFKADDVIPRVSEAETKAVQAALDAKFAVAGREMVETGGRFNFRTILGSDDLKAALNAVTAASERNTKRVVGGRKSDGVRSLRSTLNTADEVADIFRADRDTMMIVLGNDAKSIEHLDARLHTYKEFMLAAVDDASRSAEAALAAKGTADGARAASEAFHSATIASQIVSMVKGVETNVARAMNAQKMVKSYDPKKSMFGDYAELAKLLESGTYHADDEKFLKHLVSLKNNPKGFVKYMEKSFGQKAGGAFNEWYLNALLSGPKTHVANFIGNTMSTTYRPLERAVAGMMPGSSVSPGVALGRMVDEYTGLLMSIGDSLRVSGEALRQNKSILDPTSGTHLDPTGKNVSGLSSRALGLTDDYYDLTGKLIRTDSTPILSPLMDGISNFVGIPSRLLTAGDELFKQVNYRAYLYSEAAQLARSRGIMPGDDAFKNFVAQEMTRGFDENGMAKNMEARQVAREATFTQDLEYGVSRWVQGATNEHVMLKLVVPFVRTPTNLFRFAWKHTPLINWAEEGFRKDFRAGGDQRAKALAQLTTGAAMWTAAVGLAWSGNITGGHAVNPEVRKSQEATGAREYAIKVGDEYIQYNRLDPFATILGMAADFATLSSHVSQGELDKVAYGMTIALAKNLTSKTYLQGVTNIFNSIGDVTSGRSKTGLDSWFNRTAASVTVPAILNSTKGDDSLREARSVMDAIKARMPGYSKEVPPVRNVLGEVVEAPKGFGSNVASPLGYGKAKRDVVYDELARQMTTHEHPISRIIPTLGDTKIDLREVTLASGQNAYDRMQQLLWNTGVKGELQKLFTSKQWNDGTIKDSGLDYPMAPGSKMHLTNRIIQGYKEAARGQLLSENPELQGLYEAELTRDRSSGAVGPQPRVYQQPGLLDSVVGSKKNDLRVK